MADHFLTLTQQLAAAIEAVPGTAETLTAADVKLRPSRADSPFTPDYPRFENDEVAEDLAAAPDFVSGAKGTISTGLILKTSGAVGTAPAIGRYLRGCALKEQAVKTITVGAISGGDSAFAAGEVYSATGGKAGIIEAALSGSGTLRYIPTSGGDLADTNVVTANGDSATCSGASAEYGTKYSPRSTGQETLTLQRAEKNDAGTASQDFLYRLRGTMGNFSLTFNPLDAPRFAGEFSGVVSLAGAGPFLTGATYESSVAPKYINATVQLDAVALQPAEISFDAGNTVDLDPDPTTIGGTSGFDRARVSRRDPTITIAPFRVKPSEFDDLGKLQDGSTFAFLLRFGSAGNIVELSAPACQIRGWSAGDRSGLRTGQLTLHVTRASLTDADYALFFR